MRTCTDNTYITHVHTRAGTHTQTQHTHHMHAHNTHDTCTHNTHVHTCACTHVTHAHACAHTHHTYARMRTHTPPHHTCVHTHITHAHTHAHAQGGSVTLQGLRQGVRIVNVTHPLFVLCPCTGCRDNAIVGKIERGSLGAVVRGPGQLSSFSVQPLLTDQPP